MNKAVVVQDQGYRAVVTPHARGVHRRGNDSIKPRYYSGTV
jgi:hypothetical protein